MNKKESGFTLMELLITVAIMAILSGIIMTSLTSAKAKSRDGKRIADMGNIQLALELFYDKCQGYPTNSGTLAINETYTCNSVTILNYMSKVPTPPSSAPLNQTKYDYVQKSDGSDYYLHIKLEISGNEILKDAITSQPSWASGVTGAPTCNNTTDYCLGPR